MTLAFLLSMPHAASWNGKWSGEGKCYAILRNFGFEHGQKIIEGSPYHYHWPDGWCACVEVKRPSLSEMHKLRTTTEGFCGYDWMVDSIIVRGKILADHEVKQEPTP